MATIKLVDMSQDKIATRWLATVEEVLPWTESCKECKINIIKWTK